MMFFIRVGMIAEAMLRSDSCDVYAPIELQASSAIRSLATVVRHSKTIGLSFEGARNFSMTASNSSGVDAER